VGVKIPPCSFFCFLKKKMKFWGVFLSLLGLACAQTPRVTLETPFGALTGLAEPDAMLFLGVPYALPPVGEGRWRRPVDREKAPQR
jgi:hypothetical protein